ncbi:mCG148498 [Mus musculus]|nr:mCG148498 [Mus musculus]
MVGPSLLLTTRPVASPLLRRRQQRQRGKKRIPPGATLRARGRDLPP